jgi:predicted O-methyltransferase YrrM
MISLFSYKMDQVPEILALEDYLHTAYQLPIVDDWAASPKLLYFLAELILEKGLKNIVECGSGISTLVMGYSLRNLGGGILYSIENEKAYYKKNQKLIKKHNLNDKVKIIYAPKKIEVIKGKKWNWYETKHLNDIDKIDFLFVDGPVSADPISTAEGRYPALPFFWPRITSGGYIVLDDCESEKNLNVCRLWEKQFSGIARQNINSKNKAVIYQKHAMDKMV